MHTGVGLGIGVSVGQPIGVFVGIGEGVMGVLVGAVVGVYTGPGGGVFVLVGTGGRAVPTTPTFTRMVRAFSEMISKPLKPRKAMMGE